MKKIFAICILLSAFAFSAIAQTKADKPREGKQETVKTPEQKAQRITDELTTKLGLNDDQKKQIYDLALDREKKQAELKKTYASDKPKGEQEMKNYDQEIDKKAKTILTDDQYKKYQQMKEEKKKNKAENSKKQPTEVKKDVGKPAPKDK